jgi:hypothetical protein
VKIPGAMPPHKPTRCAVEIGIVREGYFTKFLAPVLS